jgi:hypothetical protein
MLMMVPYAGIWGKEHVGVVQVYAAVPATARALCQQH